MIGSIVYKNQALLQRQRIWRILYKTQWRVAPLNLVELNRGCCSLIGAWDWGTGLIGKEVRRGGKQVRVSQAPIPGRHLHILISMHTLKTLDIQEEEEYIFLKGLSLIGIILFVVTYGLSVSAHRLAS